MRPSPFVYGSFIFGFLFAPVSYGSESFATVGDLQRVNAQLMKHIEDLETHIVHLEGRLQSAEQRIESQRPPAVESVPSSAKKEVLQGVARAAEDTALSGFVDTSYTFNLQRRQIHADP